MYDIAIIGAGPAGATAARLLAGRYRILLVDKRVGDETGGAEPGQAGKLCGGLLSAAAQKELARQGLGVPAEVLMGPQLFAVRTLDRSAGLEQLYQRHYTNIDRAAFDGWLRGLVPACVERRFGWRLAALRPGADGSLLEFAMPSGARASAVARIVVGADGAASTVRRVSLGRHQRVPAYRAIQATFDCGGGDAYYGAVFDGRLTDYYGWTVPKGSTLIAGLAVPQGDGPLARFDAFVDDLRRDGTVRGPEIFRAAAAMLRPIARGT